VSSPDTVGGPQPPDLREPAREVRLGRSGPRPPIEIVLCLFFVGLVILFAFTGHSLAPEDPALEHLGAGLEEPFGAHVLGTDESGRDVLSRVIDGSRDALMGPLVVVIGAGLIGTLFGLLAGYKGGLIDAVIMRTVDLLYSLPALLVAIVALGVFGGGYWVAVAVLVVLTSPYEVRLYRGATLEQRGLPYVDAARTLGLSSPKIMARHIFPNILPIIVASSFLNFAVTLVTLSSLAFLGLGAGPGSTDWGQMLNENIPSIEANAAAALAPGIAIVLLALSMNLIGDWFYEKLAERGTAR
jgi:peptide/nickel transport system permease protein